MLAVLNPTIQGIVFLIAVVFFGIAAWVSRATIWPALIAGGLALVTAVACWNAFAAA